MFGNEKDMSDPIIEEMKSGLKLMMAGIEEPKTEDEQVAHEMILRILAPMIAAYDNFSRGVSFVDLAVAFTAGTDITPEEMRKAVEGKNLVGNPIEILKSTRLAKDNSPIRRAVFQKVLTPQQNGYLSELTRDVV